MDLAAHYRDFSGRRMGMLMESFWYSNESAQASVIVAIAIKGQRVSSHFISRSESANADHDPPAEFP